MQNFVPRSRIGILCNGRTRSTPLDPKLLFCCVLYHFGAFGTIKLPYKTRGKTFRTSAKVHATKSSRIFFATKAPDPTHWTLNSCFWCVSYHLDAFGTIRLPYESRGKMGRTSAKVRATKSNWNFSQRTHPIHPI